MLDIIIQVDILLINYLQIMWTCFGWDDLLVRQIPFVLKRWKNIIYIWSNQQWHWAMMALVYYTHTYNILTFTYRLDYVIKFSYVFICIPIYIWCLKRIPDATNKGDVFLVGIYIFARKYVVSHIVILLHMFQSDFGKII